MNMNSAAQGTQRRLVNVEATMQSGCGAQNCRVCLHLWDAYTLPSNAPHPHPRPGLWCQEETKGFNRQGER